MKRFLPLFFLSLFTLINLIQPQIVAAQNTFAVTNLDVKNHHTDVWDTNFTENDVVFGSKPIECRIWFGNNPNQDGHIEGLESSDFSLSGAAGATIDNIVLDNNSASFRLTSTGIRHYATISVSLNLYLKANATTTSKTKKTNLKSKTWTFILDVEPPLLILSVPTAESLWDVLVGKPTKPLTHTGDFKIIAGFSEPVTGFAANDIIFSGSASEGATVTKIVDSSKVPGSYIVSISPKKSGELIFTVPPDAVTDQAGHGNDKKADWSAIIDVDPPTVALSRVPSTSMNRAFDITVTFSEDVTGFAADDIDLDDGTATATAKIKGGPKVYTATITPTSDGSLTIHVPADAAADIPGNGNTASAESTVTIDRTPPTVSFGTLPSTPQPRVFDVTVAFSEGVMDFKDPSDITLGGTATATATISEVDEDTYVDTYTVTITSESEGTVTITVPADAAYDPAVNSNTASVTSEEITVDPFPPNVILSENLTRTPNGAFDITVAFSEDVEDFDDDDITLGGDATATATVDGSGKDYTATITPTDTGKITITVAADAAYDAARNGNNKAPNTLTIFIDMRPPKAEILNVPSTPQNGAFDVTIEFDEHVTDFAVDDDLAITGGTATASLKNEVTRNKRYKVTITPDAGQETDVTFHVKADAVTDAATNTNAASNEAAVPVDTLGPTVASITDLPSGEQNSAFDLTVTFSEAVNGFATEDVRVDGEARVTNVSGSDGDTEWTVTITPNRNKEGDITVKVKANTVTDSVGNSNTAASDATPNIHIDTIAPVLSSIEGMPYRETNVPFDITFTFSEPVNDFAADDFVHATAILKSGRDGDSVYEVTITPKPSTKGEVTPEVLADAVQDFAGNDIVDSGTLGSVYIDTIAPELLSIEDVPDIAQNVPFDVTLIFNEPVNGFADDDLTVTGPVTASLKSGNDGDSDYVLRITPNPTSEGDVTVQVKVDAVQDGALNTNAASDATPVGRVDTLAPTVAITEVPTAVQLAAFSVNIEFSEDVTGFELTDIAFTGDAVVENAVLTAESEQVYTLMITPHEDTDGDVTITVPADVVQDVVLHNNVASAPQTVSVAPVWIPDANLRAAIRVALRLAAGEDFSRTQLSDLETLHAPFAEITDLTGVEHAPQLTSLDVKNSQITSLKPLATATQLTGLDLSGNALTDITSLQHLTGLTSLHLSGNTITDITPLTGLTELTVLDLSDNDITDITPLEDLTSLTTLILNANDITDITPLEDLTNLTILGLNTNPISSLDPIKVLTSLTTLHLSGNALSDLSALSGLTGLQKLYLIANAITNSSVNAITGLTALTHLDLYDNKITSVTGIANLTQLISLDIRENRIDDTKPLRALTALQALYIDSMSDEEAQALREAAPNLVTLVITDQATRLEAEGFDGEFEIDIPGAPSAMDIFTHLDRATLEALDPASLKATLDRLVLESDGSQKYLHAIKLLQNVLAQLLPEETRLFANYPNPFNPETWIPYQLAKGSDVEIFIYDMRGVLVRHLALGHQHAGYYTEKSRAAYWDGRNSIGERVASGIYFYRLQAENTSLLRKMLILK